MEFLTLLILARNLFKDCRRYAIIAIVLRVADLQKVSISNIYFFVLKIFSVYTFMLLCENVSIYLCCVSKSVQSTASSKYKWCVLSLARFVFSPENTNLIRKEKSHCISGLMFDLFVFTQTSKSVDNLILTKLLHKTS